MSVTFSVRNSPTVQHVDPDDGFVWHEDVWASMNVANGSAASLLEMVGLDPTQPCGQLTVAEIPEVMRRAIRVLNSARDRKAFHRESYQEGNLFSCGIDDDRVQRWLRGFIQVLRDAQDHNQDVVWG